MDSTGTIRSRQSVRADLTCVGSGLSAVHFADSMSGLDSSAVEVVAAVRF